MSYSYTTGTNKISSISDAASATQGGFRATSGTMTYDGNGNMMTNASKGITGILYNHLNLPVTITMTSGRTIEFVYAADGTKLRKVVKTSGVIGLVQEYVNYIEYKGTSIPGTSIEAIYHAEGRLFFGSPLTISAAITNQTVQYTGTNITSTSNISGTSNVTMTASEYIQFNPGFQVAQNVNLLAQISPSSIKREYTIKDHLGNTRIAYCDLNEDGVIAVPGEILQENHYDPFGYALEGPWMNHSQPDNLYQYNGKELNGDHGLGLYDYGARWYDAGVGRWIQVDPLAEKMFEWSPYNYGFNNPIRFLDPDGMEAKPLNEYTIVVQGGNVQSTTMTGTRGGNDKDYVTVVNMDRVPYADGVSTQVLDVEKIPTSGVGNVTPNEQQSSPTPGVREVHDKMPLELSLPLPSSGGGVTSLLGAVTRKYAISSVKEALTKVYEKLGLDKPLPRMKDGKWGSPQRGDKNKGYRLDDRGTPSSNNPNETGPHINYWDYTKGKRKSGNGVKDAVPIN